MPDLTRRRLFGAAGGLAAAAFAAEFLPPSLRRTMAETPEGLVALPGDIQHVVILTQENRSFDHYFGTLPGVRGFSDPDAITLSTGRPVFYQPDAVNPAGYLLPFHLDAHRTSARSIPSTNHEWSVQHNVWNDGKMDQWLPAHRAANESDGPYTMAYYTRDDIPFQFALAESFTVCDNYFSSVMGPTWPNRLYLMSASIDPGGSKGGPVVSDGDPETFRWKTYPEALTEAGVAWKVYRQTDDFGCNVLEYFQAFQDAPTGSTLHKSGMAVSSADQFEHDAAKGRLPAVSWIIPTRTQSEHPDYLLAAGTDFVASKIDAIASNPDLWRSTLFILNYDENDGLFDHVPPPVPPAGTAGEFVNGLPIGGGFRVPCLLISPWTMGGWVATERFDHTSILRLLELLTGVAIPNLTAWRRSTFGDLTSALGARSTASPPTLPDTKRLLEVAEREVETLPSPEFPGRTQTPPRQEAGTIPRPARLSVTGAGSRPPAAPAPGPVRTAGAPPGRKSPPPSERGVRPSRRC